MTSGDSSTRRQSIDAPVESTARMAGNLGFETYLVGDATAAYDTIGPDGVHYPAATIHAMTLMNLHKEFATITTTDAVLAAVASPSKMSVMQDG